MAPTTQQTSRRDLLKVAAVGTGAAVLAASCSDDEEYTGRGVRVLRASEVPLDPFHDIWRDAPFTDVTLGPQDVALPQRVKPSVTKVRVRSVHDGKKIGFRLEWNDTEVGDKTIRVDDFRDACAVLLAPGDADESLRLMGSAETPATLLHWKADWERIVSKGDEGLDQAFPNRSVDTYPIIHEIPADEVGIDSYVAANATEWLPAIHVKNPVAGKAERASSVEKAIAYSFSTTTSAPTQDAEGRGKWIEGDGWRVVIVKPLGARDEGEIALKPGTVATCAFAVWSGGNRDVGSRKCPATKVEALELDA
ncbi:MAG: twin-arginine translocation signal domain-containing protein [Microthrixaceae bacterium]|nr:twin-arginine translocation signal domain-containing protein [Microthrixaceae bacterium]